MSWKKWIVIAATAVTGGCAAPPPAVETAPVPEKSEAAREAGEVLSLLAYYQYALGLATDEQKREYQAVNQVFQRERGEGDRLRLALLMLLPGAAWRDDARLVSLLDGALSRMAPPESPRRQLVTLLYRLAAERVRDARRLEAQNKEEQKRAEELQRRNEELVRRAEELQQKLDAMLNIERNLQRGRRQ